MLLTPAQIKRKSFESRRNSVFCPGWMPLPCLRACLGARLLPQSYQYPNLLEGADRVGGQMRGDKECPFSDVTKSGRVWRKVPENGARSVLPVYTFRGDNAAIRLHLYTNTAGTLSATTQVTFAFRYKNSRHSCSDESTSRFYSCKER